MATSVLNATIHQDALAAGAPCDWQCRAGGRYLYVCEDGLVHYCSQQRGHPGIPLEAYATDDLAREGSAVKPCAPYCTIGCVHRVAMVDDLRERPAETLEAWFGTPGAGDGMPRSVRVLRRLLVTGPERRFIRGAARRLLRI
jgi:hypothetical protein